MNIAPSVTAVCEYFAPTVYDVSENTSQSLDSTVNVCADAFVANANMLKNKR